MNVKKIAKALFVDGAFVLAMVLFGCEGPSSVKSPVSNGPANTTKYPRIDSVLADSDSIIFKYAENIKPEIFTVYYLESADSEPVKLKPATENEGGFLINGKKGEDYVKAGIVTDGQPGKYGEFVISFTSSEDTSAMPYEFKVFVTANTLQATNANVLTKLALVREPYQKEYDRGEPFNSFGMVVVAWFDGDAPGDTTATGARPLYVPHSEIVINEDELTAATSTAAKPKIKITYTYENQQQELAFPVTLRIANHKIHAQNGNGITFLTNAQAATGSYVTVTTQLDSDYEMSEEGLVITMLDGSSNEIGPVNGGFNEISPNGNDKRFMFLMPRREVRISAQTVQKASGLGLLSYKTVGMADFADIPGFVSGSHHLSYQLLIDKDEAEPQKPLTIKAGPPDNLPNGSFVTVEILKDGVILGDSGISGTNKQFAEHTITGLAPGQNYDYTVRISYTASGSQAGTQQRNYTLRIIKESAVQEVTYTYTGDYQTFTALHRGWYRVQGWGANGGNAEKGKGGAGGYAEGTIFLDPNGHDNEKMPLYIYVGGAGGNFDPNSSYVPGTGGWNGGGAGGESGSKTGSGGGGATSISTVAGTWNNIDVLGNRIFVAGGGGGASPDGKSHNKHIVDIAPFVNGGMGGGLSGSPAITVDGKKYGPYQAFLSNGTPWKLPDGYKLTPGQAAPLIEDPTAGFNGQGFGQGGFGREGDLPVVTNGNGYNGKGGGGGGWWGGRVSLYRGSDQFANNASAGGGGGSNYISGHPGSYGVDNVEAVYNVSTGEYRITVNSKDASSLYVGTGARPTAGSPNIGEIAFKNTDMNATLLTPDAMWEADPSDIKHNTFPDGHGRVIITYLGGNDSRVPPPRGN
ncbi:MAG: hypothetical protein LBD20_00830 [Spirochaetaceae bacterium]|jgi:hypothetical protein|nr:hypothetical protein [Spirochaetaceae bacterium]